MSMNLRHAAALALVGWYLMTPMPELDPGTHLPDGKPNMRAPLRYWTNQGSFDSAKECKAELESDIKLHIQVAAQIRKEHRGEQQEAEEEEHDDRLANLPKGFNRGLRGYGLTAAIGAQCVATDDPRLKGE